MKLTEAMKRSGKWKQAANGEWVVCAAAIKERVNLTEAGRKDLAEPHDNEHEYRPAKESEIKDSQLHAYQRIGLSREAAKRAVELASGRGFNRG